MDPNAKMRPHCIVEATNDHERAIAKIVDGFATERMLSPTSIEDVIGHLNFAMTKADSIFLVKYIHWRIDHPIVK